jgi:glycosyltransferase involved in cell wall biosynthesis
MSVGPSGNTMRIGAEATVIDVSVCVPVFNERLGLRQSILDLRQAMDKLPYSYEVIVIDDASTDGCIDTIRDMGVRIIRHRRNLGGGVARVTGLRYARGRLILQSDADGTYPCDRVSDLVQGLANADMVIGARNRESATDWRLIRALMKFILRTLASRLAGRHIPDLNSGMRAYHRDLALRYAYLYPSGHSIMSTMTLAFIADGLQVNFVTIDYRVRQGKSSFHPIRDTYRYFVTILRTVLYFDPLRILIPVVGLFAALATVFSIRNLLEFGSLGAVPGVLWIADLLLFVLALQSDQFSRLSRQLAFQDSTPPYHRDVFEDMGSVETVRDEGSGAPNNKRDE